MTGAGGAGAAGAAGATGAAGAAGATGAAGVGGGETSLLALKSFPHASGFGAMVFTWPGITCVRGAGPPSEAAVDF
mgnify:FL=1